MKPISLYDEVNVDSVTNICDLSREKRINTINDVSDEDTLLIGKMVQVAKNLAKKFEIDESGYRLIFNTNDDGGQSVYHIHLHHLDGEKLKW